MRVEHTCGWNKEIDVTCPRCNKILKFKESQEMIKALLMLYLNNSEKIEKLKGRVSAIERK